MSFEELTTRAQFSIPQAEKEQLLLEGLRELVELHRGASPEYARVLDALPRSDESGLGGVPYLPVNLFKNHLLRSIPDDQVFKTMTSSGTTGQQVSRITLDRVTAERQSIALAKIMTHVLGPSRLPMVVIDTPNVVKDRKSFSARGAGVLGMLSYGRKHFYALDDEMQLDVEGLRRFLDEFEGQTILLFGFTFMAWKYFYQQVSNLDFDLSSGVLIHSGGWKKLQDEAVSSEDFRTAFRRDTGLTRIHNFYGMVEQVGSVFLEADDGTLRPPNYADVLIRDPNTWELVPDGTPGVIQVLSILPTSYPGHSILTEDLGVVHGIADPATGWAGKRLEVLGRVPKTELRGCSDTHAVEAERTRL